MKKLFTAISAMLVLQSLPNAQETTKVRIGIFDSRAVAIAYARSTFFKAKMRTLQHELKTAKEAGDTTKVQKLNNRGQLQQRIMHNQAFGKGSVTSILDNVRDSLPLISKQFNLASIVSKWELQYIESSIDTINVTIPIVKLFNPDEKAMKSINGMDKVKPIEDAFFIED